MTDWKTYKGQNPWSCIAPVDFISYNEGSYIAKSPEVSGGTPTWEIGKTGAAISSKHIPCGYWFKDYDSVAHNCSCVDTILYTTLQMNVSGQQTLQASGGESDDCYAWAVSSGGGSLSSSSGKSVVYTAPSSNANCASNPTITLTCGGATTDEITIAVNAHSGTEIAYEEWINRTCAIKTYWTECCVTCMRYFCNGTVDPNPYWSNCTICATSQETHPPPQNPTPTDCATCYSAPLGLWCGSGGRSINTVMALPNDVRPEWLKNAGCCPAQLL